MNEIKIITELHEEDRYRLDLIIRLLGQSLKPADTAACVKAAAESHPVVDDPYDTAKATAAEASESEELMCFSTAIRKRGTSGAGMA